MRPLRPAIFCTAALTRPAAFLHGLARRLSELLAPALLAAEPSVAYRTFAGGLLAASLIAKLALILSGAIGITNSDGASRLFIAMDRFGDPDYFGSLSTWAALPLPIPQIYYSILYGLDLSTGGVLPVTKTVLAHNAAAFTGAIACLASVVRRCAGQLAAACFILLGVSAFSPNFVSLTAAVEPISILLFSLSALFFIKALSDARPLRCALIGAGAFSAATAFRFEIIVLAPVFACLLYKRLGFRRSAAVVLAASSYAIVQFAVQSFVDGAAPYSEIRRYYPSIRLLTLSEFLKSSLFTSGMALTWGAAISAFALFASAYSLATKSVRLLGILALVCVGFVVLAAMSGRIVAGQPRYATLAMCLLAMPAAATAAELFKGAVNRLNTLRGGHGDTQLRRAAVSLFVGAATVLAVIQMERGFARRAASPPAFAREIADALLARVAAGDAVFLDYGDGFDYAIAIRAMAKSQAPTYTYLSRCCVSGDAARALGKDEAIRLTADKTVIAPGLSLNDKFLAHQIWAHGFIERHHPRYFLIQRTKLLREAARKRGAPAELASTILPFAVRSDGDLVVELRYAAVRLRLSPIAQSSRFVLYEAHY